MAVINCGSSSIKYEVFRADDCALVATGLVERIGGDGARLRQRRRADGGTFDEKEYAEPLADHQAAFDFMTRVNRESRIIEDNSELLAVGHRVVHGGETFREPTVVDEEVVAAIRMLIPLAPLHNPSNLLGIEIARTRFPGIPQVAVFDTAFHHTLPPYAFHYALPHSWYGEHLIRRYGFHGTSHFYVSREAAKHLGKEPEETNLISLHLGNGASATAIREGVSIDTSMGMTPLEGLVMGTRSGDIDPALVFYLMRQAGISASELEKSLNSESGLKGICGLSDMREIVDHAEKGDGRARLAIDMFCYRIRKYIGAYAAVLGRVDALVFTGGIGENSPFVRCKVCSGLRPMGISVDEKKNATVSGGVAQIQEDGARVKVMVVKTDEEREIARQTIQAVKKGRVGAAAHAGDGSQALAPTPHGIGHDRTDPDGA